MPRREYSQEREIRRKQYRSVQSESISNGSFTPKKRQSRYDGGSIRYNDKHTGINLSLKQKVSDINNHCRFENLRIHAIHHEQVINQLRNTMESYIGEVAHVTKIDTKSQNILQLNLGFKYDSDAYTYLDQNLGQFQIQLNKQVLVFKPKITQAFRVFIPKVRENVRLKQAAKKQQKQREQLREMEKQRHKRRSRQMQRQRSYRNGAIAPHTQKQYQEGRLSKRSYNHFSEAQQKKRFCSGMRKVLFFGVPQFYRQKKLFDIFGRSAQLQFRADNIEFKCFPDSNAQYAQVTTSSKDAQKLINSNGILRLQGFPVVIIDGQNIKSSKEILQKLKEFQFIVTFPKKIYPCLIFRQFTTFGKIVQLIALQEIDNGQCSKFLVTISSSLLVKTIKQIGQTSEGIKFQQPEKGQMVYRPTRKTVLVPTKLQVNAVQQANTDKQKDSVNDNSEKGEKKVTEHRQGVEIQY